MAFLLVGIGVVARTRNESSFLLRRGNGAAHHVTQSTIVAALAAAILGGVALAAFRMLARERRALAAANDTLASRISELATLHSAGREIFVTSDPERIAAIVER